MEGLPPLVLGEFEYVPKGKPVLLLFPSGEVIEFSAVETALSYLENARQSGASGAAETTLFSFSDGQWVQLA